MARLALAFSQTTGRSFHWTRITAFLFFVVFSLAALPDESQNFGLLRAVSAASDDSANESDSAQKSDDSNATVSTDNNGKSSESSWFRVVRQNGAPVRVEASIVRYSGQFKDADGEPREVSVDLIGAIHFGDRDYYDAINRAFREYDTVVFELIAPEGSDVAELMRAEREKNNKASLNPLNIIPFVQKHLGDALGFVYQLDGIDYESPNLRRGDIDTVEFILQLFQNGDIERACSDAFFSMFLPTQSLDAEGIAIVAACAKDRRLALRRLLALELEKSSFEEIAETERRVASGDESEPDDVIIRLRNRKALNAVRAELESGRSKLAIFYGAAHLPDMGARLEKELGLTRDPNVRWLVAWPMEK